MTALLIASSICFYLDVRRTNDRNQEYLSYLINHNNELTKILKVLS
jgi:hypothetical protein